MSDAQTFTFDWPAAIARNRAALLRVVAALVFYAGLDEGGADAVPRRVWRRIVRLLRPAEAAARRLIVIAARGIEVAPPRPRPARAPSSTERLQALGLLVVHENVNLGLARFWRPDPAAPQAPPPRCPAFRLTDPSRRFDALGWEGARPFPADGFAPGDPDEAVAAAPLCRRIEALKCALGDLDGHARRFARWRARHDLAARQLQGGFALASEAKLKGAKPLYRGRSPLRLGPPPGHEKRISHEIDDVLRECHGLALAALKPPDTS